MKTKKIKNNISYSGVVTIELLKGDKVCKTITSHNDGFQPLFNYMASCLSGNLYPEDTPKNIRLLYRDNTASPVTYISLTTSAIPKSTSRIEEVASDSSDYPGCKTIMTFIIPTAEIIVNPNKPINALGLYSSTNLLDINKYSALFLPTNAISVTGVTAIKVTWTMTICNK